MADIKDWRSLSDSTPEWEAVRIPPQWPPPLSQPRDLTPSSQLLESMGGECFDIGMFGDISTLRDFISASKKNMTASHAPVAGVKEEKDHQVTMRDGEKITVRTYTPEKAGGPLYVMYHGGGWCIGGLENEELLCRLICGKLGFVAVNVDYRLAPEHVFPTAHNDCWDATKWVSIVLR
jgi:acetyl esterase/lipase